MEQEPPADIVRAVLPSLAWSSFKVGGFTGLAGLSVGGVSGLVSSSTPVLFAIASGIQCSALGGSFWFTRQSCMIYYSRKHGVSIPELTPRRRLEASTIAGGVSGASVAALFRGPSNVIPGTIMFSLFGFFGQSLYNALDKREAPAVQDSTQSMWRRMANSRFSPMKVLSDEQYKKMLQEKLVRVEAEIGLIDEEIEKMKDSEEKAL